MANHKWTQKEKLDAALAYVITHEASKASRLCGIPERTIREWTAKDWWPDLIHTARELKQDELDNRLTGIIHMAMDGIVERMIHGDAMKNTKGELIYKPVSARDLAWIAAVNMDKRALMRGQATSIKKTISETDRLTGLAEKFEKVTGENAISEKTKDVIH